jgi:hypothetical protein
MIYHFQLILLSAYLVIIHAAPMTNDKRQIPVESHGLSTEALLTLISVCVAVLGIALTLVLKWDSLKGMCLARRCHRRSRSCRNAAGEFPEVPIERLAALTVYFRLGYTPHQLRRTSSSSTAFASPRKRRRDSTTATRPNLPHRTTALVVAHPYSLMDFATSKGSTRDLAMTEYRAGHFWHNAHA